MSHEPECTFLNEPESVSGSCWCCAGIRAAYQRGRDDAAEAVRDLHKQDMSRGSICVECTRLISMFGSPKAEAQWPCFTIAALEGWDV